ncbi:hypothetical protein [Methyloglobulus sp.]|uniref:hypothetical protein n=1 Tax=Methyloglobulus sp. TaxID=2518622 RepID=UPI0032B72CF2
MQQIKLKKSALVAVMVLSTGYIGNASAHSLSEILPTISTMAYDLYQVSCPSGSPTNLQARVRGYGAASATTPLVRVSVSKARLGLLLPLTSLIMTAL